MLGPVFHVWWPHSGDLVKSSDKHVSRFHSMGTGHDAITKEVARWQVEALETLSAKLAILVDEW